MAIVRAQELTKRFGSFTAVDRVSFEVEEGEIFGFLGSNGAGKTTVIRILCGLLAPSAGKAEVLGTDVARDPESVKRRIGYMSQRFSLYEDLTVRQNLRFFGGVYGLRGSKLRSRERWALEAAMLNGKGHQLTRDLTKGWRQRLALASAVLHEPRVVFLDEPTGGVDPIARRQFWRQIDEMAASGMTVFVTTHYLDEAEHCHRIALMHAGELIALGSVSELKKVFGDRTVLEVSCSDPLDAMQRLERQEWVERTSIFGTRIHLVVDDPERGTQLTLELLRDRAPVTVEPAVASLEDVFIDLVERRERSVQRRERVG
ncbi:MAG: ABC transporter ATP-binding protein [Acidobacteriota bacterium]|nr:MAG: ABC transporter ATP-binding protein [Acidobacteriota bacterium]